MQITGRAVLAGITAVFGEFCWIMLIEFCI
jgi:hypothetical protein